MSTMEEKEVVKRVEKAPSSRAPAKADIGHRLLKRRFDELQSIKFMMEGGKDKKDVESIASALARKESIASLMQGEIGDRYKVTEGNERAWRELLTAYQIAEEKYPKSRYTKVVASILHHIAIDFVNRSVTSKHTNVEIALPPPPEYYTQGYGSPWKRRNTSLRE